MSHLHSTSDRSRQSWTSRTPARSPSRATQPSNASPSPSPSPFKTSPHSTIQPTVARSPSRSRSRSPGSLSSSVLRRSLPISVYVRVRPPLQSERDARALDIDDVHRTVFAYDTMPATAAAIASSPSPPAPHARTSTAPMAFTPFEFVFTGESSQQTIYDTIAPELLGHFLQGFNATIMAYGQTGSGKTYSIEGPRELESVAATHGILPRLINRVFQHLEMDAPIQAASSNSPTRNSSFTISCQYFELYKTKIRDLFAQGSSVYDDSDSSQQRSIGVYDAAPSSSSETSVIKGLSERTFTSARALLRAWREAQRFRIVASTSANPYSSRAHGVLDILLRRDGSVSRLRIIDLAGSEQAEAPLPNESFDVVRAEEGKYINRSLSSLGKLVHAVVNKHSHLPYRDSLLTRILSTSIGGNSRTILLLTVSPCSTHVKKSINTLRFGLSAMAVVNTLLVNRVTDPQSFTSARANEAPSIYDANEEQLWQRLLGLHFSGGLKSIPNEISKMIGTDHQKNAATAHELNQLQQELVDYQAQLAQHHAEKQQTVQHLEDTKNELSHSKKTLAQMQGQLNLTTIQMQQMQSKHQLKENSHAFANTTELNMAYDEIARLSQENAQTVERLNGLQHNYDQLSRSYDELSLQQMQLQQKSSLNSQNEHHSIVLQLRDTIESRDQEIHSLRNELHTLNHNISTMRHADADPNELAHCKKQLYELTNHNQQMIHHNHQLVQQIKSLEDQLGDLLQHQTLNATYQIKASELNSLENYMVQFRASSERWLQDQYSHLASSVENEKLAWLNAERRLIDGELDNARRQMLSQLVQQYHEHMLPKIKEQLIAQLNSQFTPIFEALPKKLIALQNKLNHSVEDNQSLTRKLAEAEAQLSGAQEMNRAKKSPNRPKSAARSPAPKMEINLAKEAELIENILMNQLNHIRSPHN